MPQSDDQNVAFIYQLVAIAEISHMFCTTFDVFDDLPRPEDCPKPRSRGTSPVRTASPVQNVEICPLVSPRVSVIEDAVVDEVSPVVSPCKVVLDRVVLDHSPPVGRPRSQSVKRKAAVIMSDCENEDVIPPTPSKRMAKSKVDVSLESSRKDADDARASADEENDGQDERNPKVVARKLKEAGIGGDVHVLRKLRKTSEFLKMYSDSFVQQSDKHRSNMVGNYSRVMGWYSEDNDPFKFQLSDVASVEKLVGLAQVFVDCNLAGETRHKYFSAIRSFVKAVRSSKYRDTHDHLKRGLDDVLSECEKQKARSSKVKAEDKMRKAAGMALQKDDSLEKLKEFTQQVDTVLKDAVRKIFQKCMKDKTKRVSESDLMIVNVFWISQAIKWGNRPCALTQMNKLCFKRAKECEPSSEYGNLQAIGPCRYLVTSDHKTGTHELAFIPIPMEEEWGWLEFYYKHMRPAPKDEAAKRLLFRNSEGNQISHISENVKRVMKKFGIEDPPTATELRHMVVTAAFSRYDKADRDTIATALCHNPATGLRHYVDDKTEKVLKGLGLIRGLVYTQKEAGSKEQAAEAGRSGIVAPTSGAPAVLEGSNRPISPAESTGSDGSAGVRTRTEREARSALISECLSVTVGDLPTQKEWEEALSANADRYPECVGSEWSNVRESMRFARNKLRAKQVVEELGRKKFSEGAREGLKKELEERSWFNSKCLDLAVNEYGIKSLNDRRPNVAEKATSSSLITPSVAKAITNQKWPLAKRSANDKGRCLIAQHPIEAGTVVVDYHGSLLDYRTGHERYLKNDSEENRYMYCFQHGGNKYYIDANEKKCVCHPKKELKGRLINHARDKRANLMPKTAELEGRPVVLFVASRAIEKCEELLFDYNCKGDSASCQEDLMK